MKPNGQVEADEEIDPAVAELRDIKRLLVLLLMKAGASQTEIGRALNLSQGTVSTKYRFGETGPILTTPAPKKV